MRSSIRSPCSSSPVPAPWGLRRRSRSWSAPAVPPSSACCSARARRCRRLRDVEVVAFDKTGTLTKGHPELTDFSVAPGFARTKCWRSSPPSRASSEHPIGRRIVAAAKARARAPEGRDFEAMPGFGVTRARRRPKSCARRRSLHGEARHRHRAFRRRRPRGSRSEGKSPLFAAIDGRLAGIFAVADPMKPSAPRGHRRAERHGPELAMVSGDDRRRRRRSRAARHRRSRGRGVARGQGRGGRESARQAASSSPSSATASMMRRRLPPPMSASPSARARTSPSNPPTSC